MPKDELLNLEPENLNVKDDNMLRDKINQWIENTLQRRGQTNKNIDKLGHSHDQNAKRAVWAGLKREIL